MTATTSAAAPVLRLHGITKRFGALVANDDISLDLGPGEVLALLGENGAGKSTLVSILFGHYVADAGHIEVCGRQLPPGQPKAALAAGIGMVHQHFTLADNLSVLDNVLLGTEPLWRPSSQRAAMRERLLDAAQRFGLQVRPEARVGDLSVGERQRVEILKALVRGARILILDEPTAVLTPQESESLFATLQQLVAQGLSIVFISHKLDEVLRVSHRVAVLRAGRLVAVREAAGCSKAELAELMVGRSVRMPRRERRAPGDEVLVLERVSVPGHPPLHEVDLRVRAGEVVGIAGVAGNGQETLAGLLCGLLPPRQGRLAVAGQALPATPSAWVRAGVARIPEDRHAVGVVGDLPLWENAIAERLHTTAFSRFGFVRQRAARQFAADLVQRFDVRGGGLDAPVRALSGGNMQKLILGRALAVGGPRPPVLVVANQPTWGLDVGAVAYVHQCLLDATVQGAAVLLMSEDLDEILALSDRVAVIHHGRLGPARPTGDWTLAALGLAMAGADAPSAQEVRDAA
ncbi:ABC transporter ATP-binding protein [Caldimonas thermodepolymerans]|uniref:ABC transporter ATP-binding protein n=1 Tax=Caldimonas thermodepolymerans TaxID=215580 RepID=A0A2S5T4A2_9BURK|nr:ABC transporter ATP-binding protein [Caldimonas thermodepolymerans]PPE69811.1 ABC transporter ATP-binding protein [Caldimonas thermodepolymerans]QPC32644.1 ABC transporter ATP-binding protein [Caldimonas thermodepolymerans]RDI03398.1 nucleoside ABC transporter ATP-binding protein [Caldimonas thermodepolymerans]TCP06743.1 nucleoside ABC transporter ATP-binding protein [Caldimonas thermodepolymerans]UZG49205.1 ABC transporter ATP-binding protein [Caldimonas thermodepolymerans]